MPVLIWITAHPELAYPIAVAALSLAKPLFQHRWPRLTEALMASGPDLRALAGALFKAAVKLPVPPKS